MSTVSNSTDSTSATLFSNINKTASDKSKSEATDSSKAQEAQDRFLTMLMAQMKNQDPLNPMDNAQMTTQMAQINTVSGIEKVNTSINSLASQFSQMQVMQGTSLIGHDVLTSGNRMTIDNAQGKGAFTLDSKANQVTMEVRTVGCALVDTQEMGGLNAGTHQFAWNDSNKQFEGQPLVFTIKATNGSDKVASSTLQQLKVGAISTQNGTLQLDVGNGTKISYSDVKEVI